MKDDQAFPKPKYKGWMRLVSRCIGGIYLRRALGINKVIVHNQTYLNEEIENFKAGNHILIITFRHVAKEDAPVLLMGVKKTHLRFLYGRDVLNWAGRVTSFIFPRLGFIAVQNRGTNREGLNLLKSEVQEGRFPLALAPEGQVTYHMYRSSPIQIGVANIASWALETGKPVSILPLVVGYRTKASVHSLLKLWQEKTSMQLHSIEEEAQLKEAFERSLDLVASFFHLGIPSSLDFLSRRDSLCDALLTQAEQMASIKSEGTILDRLFRLRFHAENLIYRAKEHALTELALEKLHYQQQIAKLYLRNCQVVDILEYLDPSYLVGPDKDGRMQESAYNLLDLINRIEGGTINTRLCPKGKKAIIYAGDAVRLESEELSSESRKQRIRRINTLVEAALQQTSEELSNIEF